MEPEDISHMAPEDMSHIAGRGTTFGRSRDSTPHPDARLPQCTDAGLEGDPEDEAQGDPDGGGETLSA